VHDHHRPVIEIADTLAKLFTFLDELDGNLFAREDARLYGVGELIHVEDAYPLDAGYPIEVEIRGHDRRPQVARQLYQLDVDLANILEVDLRDVDRQDSALLQPVQDFQSVAAAAAPQRVGGIGDVPQLVEDKMRDHQRALEKSGFDDLGDAAVDDRARV